LTPAVDCRQRESICLRESVKESQAQADSPAAPRKTREAHTDSRSTSFANVKTEATKADPPAKTAGEENPFSVEEKNTKADPNFLQAASEGSLQINFLEGVFMLAPPMVQHIELWPLG